MENLKIKISPESRFIMLSASLNGEYDALKANIAAMRKEAPHAASTGKVDGLKMALELAQVRAEDVAKTLKALTEIVGQMGTR